MKKVLLRSRNGSMDIKNGNVSINNIYIIYISM